MTISSFFNKGTDLLRFNPYIRNSVIVASHIGYAYFIARRVIEFVENQLDKLTLNNDIPKLITLATVLILPVITTLAIKQLLNIPLTNEYAIALSLAATATTISIMLFIDTE